MIEERTLTITKPVDMPYREVPPHNIRKLLRTREGVDEEEQESAPKLLPRRRRSENIQVDHGPWCEFTIARPAFERRHTERVKPVTVTDATMTTQ